MTHDVILMAFIAFAAGYALVRIVIGVITIKKELDRDAKKR